MKRHEHAMPPVRQTQRATAIDKEVGKRIKDLRVLQGRSQSWLANQTGITFQQLQKYEAGINRVTSSRLYVIAGALSVPVDELFRDDGNMVGRHPTEARQVVVNGFPMTRETLQLARYASSISSGNRRALIAFAKASQAMIQRLGEGATKPKGNSGRATRRK